MREIKFRGKDRTGKWLYGGYVEFAGSPRIIYEAADGPLRALCPVRVIPSTVGQFTGLRDANGTEIYEGDIVRAASGTIYEVIFEQGAYRVKGKKSKLLLVEGRFYEVINSVHDAPELLKK